MKFCRQRHLLSLTLVLLFSFTSVSADGPGAPGAVLHTSGKVQVNGRSSSEIIALFSGDAVQTDVHSVATIVARGSSVLVFPNASVQFLGNAVELTQGTVAIATSEEMSARAYGLTIKPAEKKFSKFEVSEDQDDVVIVARQGSVSVTDGQQSSTVQEGQQSTQKKRRKGAAAPAASGNHLLSGKTLAILAVASGAVAAGILLTEGNTKKKCVSPSGDRKCN